jgi:hypothetical protein
MPWRETIIRVHSQQFTCEGGQIVGARCGVHEFRVVEDERIWGTVRIAYRLLISDSKAATQCGAGGEEWYGELDRCIIGETPIPVQGP